MNLTNFWKSVKKMKGASLLTKTGKVIRISNKKNEITDTSIIVYRKTPEGSVKGVKIFRKQLENMFGYVLQHGKLDLSMFSIQLEFGIKEAACAYSILASLPMINCIDKKGIPLKSLRITRK